MPVPSIMKLLMTLAFLSIARAKLPSQCPTPEELQSDYVKAHFDVKKMEGFWYEIAMKDMTEPRICKCITSDRKVDTEKGEIRDLFTLECAGIAFPSHLSFNLTETPGVSIGTWNGIPLVDRIKFPNTVVDVGVDEETGEYDWMIEFQCITRKHSSGTRVAFYAFNFYSKEHDLMGGRILTMEQHARDRGLGPFIDTGKDLAIIDHTGCVSPTHKPSITHKL